MLAVLPLLELRVFNPRRRCSPCRVIPDALCGILYSRADYVARTSIQAESDDARAAFFREVAIASKAVNGAPSTPAFARC